MPPDSVCLYVGELTHESRILRIAFDESWVTCGLIVSTKQAERSSRRPDLQDLVVAFAVRTRRREVSGNLGRFVFNLSHGSRISRGRSLRALDVGHFRAA